MAFPQVYYTSCTVGLRGTKGFQVHAATDGIEPDLVRQIERLGVYVAPLSAPSRPGPDELAQFPTSLLFQPLADGRAVIAQAKYTGADYSGRFGNYFTHSLVADLAPHDFRDFLPIELWRSPSWQTTESATTTLPPLEQPEAGAAIDPGRVRDAVVDGERLPHLADFLAAIQAALVTRRRVVIADHADGVAQWIAAASYALPRHLALQLSFNTYVKNPYQADALVVGVTLDSDFKFAPHEVAHQYFVFDFLGHRFTPMGPPSAFARMAKAAYQAGRADDLAGFGRFVERAAPALAAAELDAALACYGHAVGLEVDGVGGAGVLRWCAPRLRGFEPGALRRVVARVLAPDSFHPELVAAGAELHRAGCADGVDAARRAATEEPYADWLVAQASRSAPPELLARALDGASFGAAAVAHARSLRPAWFEQVKRQPTDAARLAVLLELGDALGFLAEGGEVAHSLGERVLGPALGERPVRTSLLRLASRPAGPDLLRGLGDYLATRVADPETFRRLGAILGEPPVAAPLAAYARAQRAAGLYFRLAAARTAGRPDLRVRTFQDCLAAARELAGDVLSDDVELAYDAVWQDQAATVEEALELLVTIDAATLATTRLPAQLARALAGVADVSRPDERTRELVARLSAPSLSGALADAAPLVDAFAGAGRLVRREGSPGPAIRSAIDGARALPDEAARRLLELAGRRLLELPEPAAHRELLIHGHVREPARFLRAYAEAVVAQLGERPPPAKVADVLRLWLDAERAAGSELATALGDQVFPRALADWGSKERAQVSDALGADRAARDRWERWREVATGGGVFGRLKRWLRPPPEQGRP